MSKRPQSQTTTDCSGSKARFGPKGDARRSALIEAGYRVVLAHGLAGLTFRAVAAEAGVPLGSASYYFADKNVLLFEIISLARHRVLQAYEAVEARVVAGTPWIVALSEHVAWVTSENYQALVRDYEMFLYGFEHPELVELSKSWIILSHPSLRRILPPDLLAPVGYLLEGMFLAAAKTGRQFTADEVRHILGRMDAPGA